MSPPRILTCKRPALAGAALLGLGVLFVIHWYWSTGPTAGSDLAMTVFRSYVLDQSVHEGLLFPRWGMDLNFTYGAPLFQYKSPLAHYVILFFHWMGLGWVQAAKATVTAELLVASLGVFVYVRWLFRDVRAALVAACAYLLAPYLLLDLYERGAVGEALALAILPWAFWALHRTVEERSLVWPWALALLIALLALAHNVTAFFLVPVLVLYAILVAWHLGKWKRLLVAAGALALGLGMSAFYWAPALFEREYAQITEHMLESGGGLDVHLTPLRDLIQPALVFDYYGSLRRHLSLWQAVVGALALALVLIARPLRPWRLYLGFFGVVAVVVLVLQLDVSAPFWHVVPMVRYIQFPWRLLGIASLSVAVLIGGFLCLPWLSGRKGWIFSIVLLALMLYSSTARVSLMYSPRKSFLTEAEITEAGLFNRGRRLFTPFSDFLPAAVRMDPPSILKSRPQNTSQMTPLAEVPAMRVREESADRLALEVDASQPFPIRFHRFYFPGWQVLVDGRPIPTGPSGELGLVTAEVPAGDHEVVLQFDQTPLRRVADALAIGCLLFWVVFGFALPAARRPGAAMLGVSAALVVLLVAHQGFGRPVRHPLAYPVTFAEDLRLLAYDLPKQSWQAGDVVPIRLYWLTGRAPLGDMTVFVHLIKQDDSEKVAQIDSQPVLGYSPTSRWEPGEVIVDRQLLPLGEDLAPGTYRMVVGLYRLVDGAAQNVAVLDAPDSLPGDRVHLTDIEVSR